MSRAFKKRLSEDQRRELEQAIQTTRDVKIYRRAKVILYKEAGFTAEEIEWNTEYSEREQWWWLARYRQEELPGLEDRPRSGRPRLAPIPKAESESQPPKNPPLEEAYRVTLEEMHSHHPKPYLRDRAQMALLRDKGYSEAEIAHILGVGIDTVRSVLARYDEQGLLGLYRKRGSGRPARLRTESWEQVKDWVLQGPKAVGHRFIRWTTRSLRTCIAKKWGVLFSREWIRRQLHRRLGCSWTRGKKVYAHRHDEAWKAKRKAFCRRMLKALEQARQGSLIMLFEDETIFTLAGEVGYSWSPTGETQEVPSEGKKQRIVVFGAVNPITGQTHSRIDETINQETTLRFLQQLVRYYQKRRPGIAIMIVLDKHPGHTAASVSEYIGQNAQVTLVNTPNQSPDLNPIEHLWDWLSERMIKNAFFETVLHLKQAVRQFFSYLFGIKERVLRRLGNMRKLYIEVGVI